MSVGRRFRASASLPCINTPIITGLDGAKAARWILHVSVDILCNFTGCSHAITLAQVALANLTISQKPLRQLGLLG